MIGLDGSIIVTVKRAPGEATGGIVALSPNGVVQWHYGVPEDVSGCAAIDQAGNIHFGTQSGNYYIIKQDGRTFITKANDVDWMPLSSVLDFEVTANEKIYLIWLH